MGVPLTVGSSGAHGLPGSYTAQDATASPDTSASIVVACLWFSGSIDEPGEHGADRMQRSRRNGLADQLGDDRQILDAVAGHASPAELLGHQQAGPAQFGSAPPPFGLERDPGCREAPAPG